MHAPPLARWLAPPIAVIALAAQTAPAATICVQSPACPAGGQTQPTIAAALTQAAGLAGRDRIVLGPRTFTEPGLADAAGNPVDIVGASAGKTTIAAPDGDMTTTLAIAEPTSTVSDLTVQLSLGTNETGLQLYGTAQRVAVAGPAGAFGAGVALQVPGHSSFSSGSVTLAEPTSSTGVIGTGILTDTTITAATGVATFDMVIQRVRMTARAFGVSVNTGVGAVATLDDVLIQLVGSATRTGVSVFAGVPSGIATATLTARHVTVVGNGQPGSTGISAQAVASGGGTATVSVTASDVILRALSLDLAHGASGGSADIALDYSDYDPAKVAGATGTVTPGTHNVNVDPAFRAAAAGDFSLRAGSPLIDAGSPAAAVAGESKTDVAGQPRVVDGDKNGSAITDVGAFEYQLPKPPVVIPVVPPLSFLVLGRLTLTHARFAVAPPPKAKATARKRRRHAIPRGTTIRFTLSRAAKLMLAIERATPGRRADGRCAKPTRRLRTAKHCTRWRTVGRLTSREAAGVDRVFFSGRLRRHALAPGSYRFVAVATVAGLRSRPRSARFTIVKP